MFNKDALANLTEIINLEAIQQLPKATEHFVSDLHGEYDAFDHICGMALVVFEKKSRLCLPAS